MFGAGRFLCIFCGFLFCVQVIFGVAIWEFGKNRKNSKVVAYDHGGMSIAEKLRYVVMRVPECMKVVYVRVDLQNDFTAPEVRFNTTSNTVKITYMTPQNSICFYDVVARAVPDKNCGGNKKSKMEAHT